MEGRFVLSVCVLISCLQSGLAHVWEFGEDTRDSQVVSHVSGKIHIFEKTKYVQLTIPPCHKVTYVRAEVNNLLTTPAVTFNKDTNTVVIQYKLLQPTFSTYDITAKAKPSHHCYGSRISHSNENSYNSQSVSDQASDFRGDDKRPFNTYIATPYSAAYMKHPRYQYVVPYNSHGKAQSYTPKRDYDLVYRDPIYYVVPGELDPYYELYD